MQYSGAIIFHKRADLMPYFYAHYDNCNINKEQYDRLKARYAVERDVRLILLVRYDGRKTFCRIKCPINPMPIKGEFETYNIRNVCAFLDQHGWEHSETYNLAMFR